MRKDNLSLVGIMLPSFAHCYVLLHANPPLATRLDSVSMGWSSPGWNWGSAIGEAHEEAMNVRAALATPEARRDFLRATAAGDTEIEEAKMALALKCQRARNRRYDTDRRWEMLMEEMASCEFEGDDGIEKLAEAIRLRLRNEAAIYKDAEPREWIAIALNKLGFVERGL